MVKQTIYCDICKREMKEPNVNGSKGIIAVAPQIRRIAQQIVGVSGDGSEVCEKCEKHLENVLTNYINDELLDSEV